MSKVKFKWWYCLILGIATIIDGLTMFLSLGFISTGLALKISLFGASKKIYKSE